MTFILRWLRQRKLEKLRAKLFELERSMPPATYNFNESQIVMAGRACRIESLKSQINKLEAGRG